MSAMKFHSRGGLPRNNCHRQAREQDWLRCSGCSARLDAGVAELLRKSRGRSPRFMLKMTTWCGTEAVWNVNPTALLRA